MAPLKALLPGLLAVLAGATPVALAFSTVPGTGCRAPAGVISKSTTTMMMAARRGRDDGAPADPPANPAAAAATAVRAAAATGAATGAGKVAPVGRRRGGDGPDLALLATSVSRGGFFASVATAALGGSAVLTGATLGAPEPASANGMLDFPPARLNNRYFLMRAGQGGADKEGLVQSHPIDKLHMDNRLTEQGVEEAQRAAGVLASLGVYDAFIWADISSRAQDTARILAQELNIRQERVVPEYAFLEPRGMGIFDGKDVASVLPVVYKEDANSLTWRPPPNTDGTPNESVDDVFVRVRQLLSKLETQYQGEDVIIVGADSDCLSVLQSFVLGEDMKKHSKYYLRPGEGRQLRTSVDTVVGYQARREAKGNTVVESGGGISGEGA